MGASSISGTIDAVWRIEAAKLIAVLSRMLRDVGLAEELAQEALVAALEEWPKSGIPDHPGAWLMTTAKRRALDYLRRARMLRRKHEMLTGEADIEGGLRADTEAMPDPDDIDDELLRLIFVACHPVLPQESRSALTLRLLCGLTTGEIARAFLVPEPTIAQRIVRAKRSLREAGVTFELPSREERPARLASVLEVIYLVFNEGYSATSGEDWMRPALCEEALRLGRILAELTPQDSEVHGLVALMELQASRLGARVDAEGNPILLMDQNRGRWDQLLIRRGLAALARGRALTRSAGPYLLQASIAARHARAASGAETDWAGIAELYDDLARVRPSPVVELNRAVAVAMARGPTEGLVILDRLEREGSLAAYHLLPSVRGDLLQRLGRHEAARREFLRAASLTDNERERRLLRTRAESCHREPS